MDTTSTGKSANLREILARNRAFRGLPERILARLSAVTRTRKYKRNERVFSEGDDGDAIYGIVSGRVRINVGSALGHEMIVRLIEPDGTFGETSVLDGHPRMTSAIATEPTTLIAISRADLRKAVGEEPEIKEHLLQLLCEHARETRDLINNTILLLPAVRLAKHLLVLAEHQGTHKNTGIEVGTSQTELANSLGLSRQNVNGQLKQWKERGWIAVARSRVLIIDVLSLTAIVNADAGAERPPIV